MFRVSGIDDIVLTRKDAPGAYKVLLGTSFAGWPSILVHNALDLHSKALSNS